jgi:hypothetical protein
MTSGCPGCGVSLPSTGQHAAPPRRRASAECWQRYGEVAGAILANPAVLGRWHQTSVDAYAAQHVAPDTPAITVCFALNGLYLVLERGLAGTAAREAHRRLASTVDRREWPRFTAPARPGAVTVLDVNLFGTPQEQARAVERWGRSVWQAWSHVHEQVREMTERQPR